MTTPCGCEETPCIQTDCACSTFIKSDCVTEVTVDLPCSGTTKGKTLNETLIAIDAFICSVRDSINTAFTTLKNVGVGAGKVYKGISIFGEKEIKSIKGTTYININNLTDEVEVAVNETALTTLIGTIATGATNLGRIDAFSTVTITSDTGTDAEIQLVDDVSAGLVSPTMWGLIQTIPTKVDIANQIEVSASTTVQNSWHGKTVIVSGNLTFTVPAVSSLVAGMTFEIITLAGASLAWSETVANSFLFGTPSVMAEKGIATFMRRNGTNKIMLLGQEII